MRAADWLIALALAVGGLLLFVGGPAPDQRVLSALWNLGHIPLFALLAYVLLRCLPVYRARPLARSALVLMLCLLIGLLVEILQSKVARSFAWLDVAYDAAGAAVVLLWLRLPRPVWQRLALCTVIVLACAVKPALVVADALTAQRQFPVLVDFSSALEHSRFSGSAPRRQLRDPRALAVQFQPGERYSTLTLKHFPPDWHRYDMLEMEVENAAVAPLALTCRIHDAAHEARGFAHDDRFNRRFTIAPGRTVLSIALEDIATAPTARRLELKQVVELTCFANYLTTPTTLLIHRIALR